MTRIIAGFAGSRELKVPPAGTRPTSDRVREAVFGALEARDAIAGSRVLDLYAGSGALGLEALSRGASSVTLVEKHAKAASVAATNAELVRTAGNLDVSVTRVVTSTVTSFLSNNLGDYDLVFIDPPYDLNSAEIEHALEMLVPRLSEYGEIVLERSSRSSTPVMPQGLTIDKSKSYGETTIYWISATAA